MSPRHIQFSPVLSLILLYLTTISSLACGGAQKKSTDYVPPGQTECKITKLKFKGLDVVEEEDLLEGLATQENKGWRTRPFVQKLPILGAEASYYNSVRFERDLQRILTYYKQRGYFNAKITGQSISRCIQDNDVSITLTIKEGAPSGISSIDYEGIEGLPSLLKTIKSKASISVDDVFTQSSYLIEKESIERVLKQQSYAYARVTGKVVVNPATRQAAVTFFIDSGPASRFETPTIEGLDRVTEDYVRAAVTFEQGEDYNSQDLQKTQEQLYDLGVFSLVTVQPDFQFKRGAPNEANEIIEEDDEPQEVAGALGISDLLERAQNDAAERTNLSRRVPITIRVKEAKNWTGRVGAGFAINSTRQDVHAAFNVTSRNFLGKLGKLEQFNTVGYALTPGLIQVAERRAENSNLSLNDFGNKGVFFDLLLRYSQPQLFERLTTGFMQAKVTRDIQENYIGLIPSGTIGLRRQVFVRELQLELSYNVQYIRYQNFADDFAKELRIQGLNPNANDGRPSLLLEYFEQKLIYDRRDSPINPTRGIRAQVSLQEARSYVLGGEYRYIKPRISMDGYIPIGKGAVSAFRMSLGAVYNTNPEDGDDTLGIPLQAKIYSGGKGSMRSFGPRYFGFFTDDLVDPGPIGSNTLFEVGVEQRLRIKRNLFEVGDLWGSLFLDAGSFSNEQLYLDSQANQFGTLAMQDLLGTMIYGLGGGIYWLTPVGPLRADLAITLTDLSADPRFGQDPNVTDDPNTFENEAILERRYSEARLNKIRGFDFYIGIGHSF